MYTLAVFFVSMLYFSGVKMSHSENFGRLIQQCIGLRLLLDQFRLFVLAVCLSQVGTLS